MYVIVDKATQAVLHMSNSYPGEDREPKELMPGFDPATMDFARSPSQALPPRFRIVDGVVQSLDDAAPALAPAVELRDENLAQARERVRRDLTSQALARRAALVPDYQLLNAGIGLYDEARVASLRATVQAFRDEVARVEGEIAKARTVKALDALQVNFPTALVVPAVGAKA